MQIKDYISHYDHLEMEDIYFDIPIRKKRLLHKIGGGKKILDVGCLGGKLSQLMMRQNNEVWCIEANPKAAEVAQNRGLRVKIANVEDGLPFGPESFDIIHAGEVLEHLYDTKSFFDESWRVLKKGGQFIFTVSNLNSLGNRIRILSGNYLSSMGAYPEDHHGSSIRAFNIKKIQELCLNADFKVLEIQGIPCVTTRFPAPAEPIMRLSRPILGKFLPGLSELLMIIAEKPKQNL